MQENGARKVYGAGILSSFGEMEWSCSNTPSLEVREKGGVARDYPDMLIPKIVPLTPHLAASTMYPITTYQPIYFSVKSFAQLKEQMFEFCDSMLRSFHPQYDPLTRTIRVDRSIVRRKRQSMANVQVKKQQEYFEMVKQGWEKLE